MTREEAIKALTMQLEHWEQLKEKNVLTDHEGNNVVDVLKLAIKALQAEPKTKCVARIDVDTEEVVKRIKEEYDITDGWIPINERLPKVGEVCLLTVHEYGWNCKEYTRVVIGEYSDNYAGHILAWMPLPKPYREDSEV